jgi:hypothetical protein
MTESIQGVFAASSSSSATRLPWQEKPKYFTFFSFFRRSTTALSSSLMAERSFSPCR